MDRKTSKPSRNSEGHALVENWLGFLIGVDPKFVLPFNGVPAIGFMTALASVLTNCPRCGESAFYAGMLIQRPLPNKHCKTCGLDLRDYYPFEPVDENEPDIRKGNDHVQS